MKKSFIDCGFEFTASFKKKGKWNTKLITKWNSEAVRKKTNISDYTWINRRFSDDPCGCEVSTPIVKSKKETIRYYNEFSSFVKSVNLTTNINEAECCLGGCHIHMNLSDVDIKERRLFLINIAIFFTNNPWLNWGFNDPNDNWNANSLLTPTYYNNPWFLQVFGSDAPLEKFIKDPLTYDVNKEYAIRYNGYYKSIEFRIFDMPTTLKQHLLHYDVAREIYNYCLKLAKKGEIIELKYKSMDDYTFTEKEAISNFDKVMTFLKISKNRTAKMRTNIKTRYNWNKEDKQENYLL